MGAKSGGEKLRLWEWPARILCSTGNSPVQFLLRSLPIDFVWQTREYRGAGYGFLATELVVKNDVEKRTVNLQIITAVIINEPQFSKPIHEKAHPRASRSHHLCQGLLTQIGDYTLRHALLAE